MRPIKFVALAFVVGCSFLDDFDKFEARDGEADDAGSADAGRDGATLDEAGVADGGPHDGAVAMDAGDGGAAGDGALDRDVGGPTPDAHMPGTCASGSSCSDGDPCTQDGVCDPGGACVFRAIDGDGDGYSPAACAAGSALRGGDCDDDDSEVHPGAREQCDGVDNDCEQGVDQGFARKSCYPDRDDDGFIDLSAAIMACMCPEETREATDTDAGRGDCWDDPDTGGDDVHPTQTQFFEDGYGPGSRREEKFDYDCDGATTGYYQLLPAAGCGGVLGLACGQESGFTRTVPGCGESEEFTICGANGLSCTGRTEQRKQLCR